MIVSQINQLCVNQTLIVDTINCTELLILCDIWDNQHVILLKIITFILCFILSVTCFCAVALCGFPCDRKKSQLVERV